MGATVGLPALWQPLPHEFSHCALHPIGVWSTIMVRRVILTRLAQKQLQRMPRHIVENLAAWVDDVETRGLEEARKVPGYHDEPLHGGRHGQRSIRLSRSYRAI